MNRDSRKIILVVDDEPGIRNLVKNILANDFVVLEAKNGDEAISIARSQKPDLILMDIKMPKTDGYTACSMLRADKQTKAIPVVIVSSTGQKLNKALAQRSGANDYLPKPFTSKEPMDMIGKFL